MKANRNNLQQFVDTDTIFLALITAFFLITLIATFDMKERSMYLLPRLLGVSGLIIGVVSLIVKFNKVSKKGGAATFLDEAQKPRGIHIAYTVIFTVIYFFLMRYLGFILTTVLAIVAFSLVMRLRNRAVVITVAIVLPIVLHSLFVTLLKVSLPEGIVESILPF